MKSLLPLLVTLVLFKHHGVALQVTPGSACAALCLDDPEGDALDPKSSNTTPDDIVCTDEDYETSGAGIKYKNCIDCLQKSNATSGTESDTSWFLYNVRYSVDVCVYGFPNATKGVSSPCDINYACQPLKTALESGSLSSTGDQYEYCSADGGSFLGSQTEACLQCFASSTNQAYLSNFITALKAGCQQKPAAGTLLGLSGSLFTDSQVNITAPPVQETEDTKGGSTGMTTGAIVGIAVGAALLFLGGTGLFYVYYRKQKRLYSDPVDSNYHPQTGSKSISPPLYGSFNLDMPQMAAVMSDYELRSRQAYTNNADYYEELEKEIQTRRPHYASNPNQPSSGPQGALPTHPAYVPQAHSRQASADSTVRRAQPIRTNRPDSYALQTYLSAAEDANAMGSPPPPPGPPPAAAVRGSSPYRGPSSLQNFSHSRASSHSPDPSFDSRGPSPDRRPLLQAHQYQTAINSHQHQATQLAFTPPPPPPRAPKVPSLSLPSVPRIRVPKKYSPPKITVEFPTPVDQQDQQADLPIGLEISRPIVTHEARFGDDAYERRRKEPPAPLIVNQTAVDRRPKPWIAAEAQVKSGNSAMYG
ncbi:Uu.00g087110.m01.CDS01 [Anthostomella pinea]|uniref:Uu.00g087110.m01.CDS01 n=1 Tax=Anthostomella pinea TaxID=933095 RepID=A0AAI8VNF1_9PEZI|nr:Uu.00g087110.m01.CDS01 [Anthostomella pinea]